MIKIFITGGTIDCCEIDKGHAYQFGDSIIPDILKDGRCTTETNYDVLMMKDSALMTDADRNNILKKCIDAGENEIIITHGTDTMVETARTLGKSVKDKTIVLLGAIVPFNQPHSDASFNFGGAVIAVQILPKGIYIIMNGKIFKWNNVLKDKERMIFKELS